MKTKAWAFATRLNTSSHSITKVSKWTLGIMTLKTNKKVTMISLSVIVPFGVKTAIHIEIPNSLGILTRFSLRKQ